MKKNVFSALVLVVALSFGGCAKEPPHIQSQDVPYFACKTTSEVVQVYGASLGLVNVICDSLEIYSRIALNARPIYRIQKISDVWVMPLTKIRIGTKVDLRRSPSTQIDGQAVTSGQTLILGMP